MKKLKCQILKCGILSIISRHGEWTRNSEMTILFMMSTIDRTKLTHTIVYEQAHYTHNQVYASNIPDRLLQLFSSRV